MEEKEEVCKNCAFFDDVIGFCDWHEEPVDETFSCVFFIQKDEDH